MKVKAWLITFGLAGCLFTQTAVAKYCKTYELTGSNNRFALAATNFTVTNNGPQGAAIVTRDDLVIQDVAPVKTREATAFLGDARDSYFLTSPMYYDGQGVPQDHVEAVKWYRKSANQNYASAQYNLGVVYREGQGVQQDFTESAKWFRMAADQGFARAQLNLGTMYINGQGVPKDYVQAHMWLSLAAAGFPASDTVGHDFVARNLELFVKELTPDQIAEAERLAVEWLVAHPKK